MKNIIILILMVVFSCTKRKESDAFYQVIHETKSYKSLEKALKEPEKVESLDLYFSCTDELNKKLLLFKNLKIVHIYKCEMVEVPNNLWELKNIIQIEISKSNITKISSKIGQLKKLKSLVLVDNPIKILPNELFNLNLLHLHIQNNSFLDFENLIVQCSKINKLEHLLLSSNKLKLLPKEIGKAKSIEDLVLDNNELINLPDEIGNLEKLIYLGLKNNKLTDLPKTITKCKNLKYLVLEGNLFTKTKKEELKKMLPNVKLYFGDNDK